MKRYLLTAVTLSGLIGAVAWVTLSQPQSDNAEIEGRVLATVNNRVITDVEFRQEMERRGGKLPSQYQTVEQRRALLDVMVDRQGMLLAAIEAGYDKDPVIQEQLENMMIQKLTTEVIQKHLKGVSVSEAEIKDYFEAHAESYARPARRQLALIKISLTKGASDDVIEKGRAKAEQALAEVVKIEPGVNHFAGVARNYSDDRASRYRGGVIGWLVDHPAKNYRWDASVVDAAFNLQQEGEISELIHTDTGFYILRLVQNEPERAQAFEQVRDGIEYRLLRDKRKQEKHALLASMQSGLEISVNESVLESIEPLSRPASLLATRKPPKMP